MLQRRKLASLLIACGAVSAGPALAQSGNFTFVIGDVSVQRKDGQRVPVARGTPVNPGDAIVTGARGMAQLTMVDKARISLRPNTQFQIEQYAEKADSDQGALLRLVRGTMRAFTGLISARNRDRFVMKTKVATVGIRGSGNVLFAGTAADCDPDKVQDAGGSGCDITVNHTIEGSHAVTFGDFPGSGVPPQQGGAQTLITGPGQTVLVTGRGEVKYIPTPAFIAEAAINPTGAAKSGKSDEGRAEKRNFGPGDDSGSAVPVGSVTSTPLASNGLGFVIVDASGNLLKDPTDLRDIVIASSGAPFEGQATGANVAFEDGAFRSYSAYEGTQTDIAPTITGGVSHEVRSVPVGNATISLGRWQDASLGYAGPGSTMPEPGSIHWILSNSGFPTYLSDVLTGTATYELAAATSPTNQFNTSGSLNTATLNVNFTNRTLDAALSLSLPSSGSNAGGTWNMNAQAVPFALNSFYASTSDRLVVNNGTGQSSASNSALVGSIEGSFVSSTLQGAILGYGIVDQTAMDPAGYNTISGVAAFTGPPQSGEAPYRDVLFSDPSASLANSEFTRGYGTVDRPDEVVSDSAGQVNSFVGPLAGLGNHAVYSRGSASVLQAGTDPETGLVWGRWSGGMASVTANGQTVGLDLGSASLHYVMAGTQSGPVALPLTGTAVYDVLGATSPTDVSGHVGTLNTATLNANFTTRAVDALVNFTINGQTWNGRADGMPIYRDQYFSAYTPGSIQGASGVSELVLSCMPNCGPSPHGSLDGFFAGQTGQRAGVSYNFNGNAGAVAFGRRGG